ncbi:MAG TPA: crotonase/enoyl-CoA hydratase family protein [Candidatus Methylomirabilis sp.]|nr:crotonase/enoyl-CoA hydratase family protein [Candidatus Methylomirabilis sp.]
MTTAFDTPERNISRRDLLALAGTVSTVGLTLVRPSLAQSPGGAAPDQPQGTGTVVLDRLPMGVMLIGIDRVPARNRIDVPTFNALGQAYYTFHQDEDLRVAVLYGNGPDFSQGLDLPSWGAALRSGSFQAPAKFLDPLGTSGPERSKPLVVAVQGRVTRIAHELFLAADVRIAAKDAVFNQGEVTAASFPGGGATVRFVREAGWANAMRYMLTGRDWDADEAYRMGLVQEVTAPGRQLDRALDIARQIAAAAPLGVRATLASARRALRDGETAAMLAMQPEFGRLLRSEDRQEYVRALQEKRAPAFVGR